MSPRNIDEQPLSGFAALVPPSPAGPAEYLHCQEPMRRHDPSERSIYDPIETGSDEAEPLPEVRLETWILRCRCGFQLEVPH